MSIKKIIFKENTYCGGSFFLSSVPNYSLSFAAVIVISVDSTY